MNHNLWTEIAVILRMEIFVLLKINIWETGKVKDKISETQGLSTEKDAMMSQWE